MFVKARKIAVLTVLAAVAAYATSRDPQRSMLLETPIKEVVSRPSTVVNRLEPSPIVTGLSRAVTVINRSPVPLGLQWAVSRALTIMNEPTVPVRDAISRSYTAVNRQTSFPQLNTAISRATSVRNNLLKLERITPSRGGDTGLVTVTILGGNLNQEADVVLSGPIPPLTNGPVTIVGAVLSASVDATRLTVRFDLEGQPRGAWDLTVCNRNPVACGRLDRAFTIEAGTEAQLWVDIVGRSQVRAGTSQPFDIILSNRGNVDAVGVPLWISGIPESASWSLGFPVSPPRPTVAGDSVDWENIPVHYVTAGEVNIPLLVPVLPPSQTQVRRVHLTAPAGPSIPLRARVGRPFASPRPSVNGVADCILAITDVALGVIGLFPGLGCLNDALIFVSDFMINLHLAAENENKTLAIGQLSLDIALTAIGCAGEEVPIIGDIYQAIQLAMSIKQTDEECSSVFNARYGVEFVVQPVVAVDPNEKVGIFGFGDRNWVASNERLTYTIFFENDADSATAAARDVVITDRLDTSRVDPQSISFGAVAVGAHRAEGQFRASDFSPVLRELVVEFPTRVDPGFEIGPVDLLVRTEAVVNTTTGELRWHLTTLDPLTRRPPEDPLIGFLPPNVNPSEGEGSVTFTILQRSGLTTGTEICNRAEIVFDANAPITACAPGEPKIPSCRGWCNTIDAAVPSSSLTVDLIPGACPPAIALAWSGADQTGGSGIRSFTTFASVDGGEYVPVIRDTSQTTMNHPAVQGHSYRFYTRATDNVGNLEPAPPVPDDQVQISIDLTGDGVVDLRDFNVLLRCQSSGCTDSCLTGPVASVSPECCISDLDVDHHVDLRDLALFQRAFGE